MQSFDKKIILFDIDYTLFNTDILKKSNLSEFKLYDESINVLENLSKYATLGIFSQGDTDFQMRKLRKSKIIEHFLKENIHIVSDKHLSIQYILDKYVHEQMYLVDDKLFVLQAAKAYMPSIYTIWIRRGQYAEKQKPIEGFTPDLAINTLDELQSIFN